MERRDFLRTAALSTLAAASFAPLSLGQGGRLLQQTQENRQQRQQQRRGTAAAEEAKKIPIAVQLYSVRNAADRDLAGTLEAIAKMGYDGVEFAGYYGKNIGDIRKMLDDNGLKCAGTHTGLGEFRNNFDRTVEIHKTLGTKFMIVPGGLNQYYTNVDTIKGIADEFNQLAERAKAEDLYIGYHAHGYDAVKVDGVEAWERFFGATIPEVVMQMDVGNYLGGGGDPYRQIGLFPGRSKTVHIKEAGQGHPIVGSGTVDWKRIFELSETVGGVEWYVVEDEVAPDNLERIEKCILALREMGK